MKKLSIAAAVIAIAALASGTMLRAADTKDNADIDAKSAGPTLLVDVEIPPTWRPFLADDIADAFTSRLSEVFHRRGFKGAVRRMEDSEKDNAKTDRGILTLNLHEWRVDRLGNVQCTFYATIRGSGGEKDLGVFNASAITWQPSRSRWELSNAFDDAARGALGDLYDKMMESHLLPDVAAGP